MIKSLKIARVGGWASPCSVHWYSFRGRRGYGSHTGHSAAVRRG